MKPDSNGAVGQRPQPAPPGDAKTKKQLALVAVLLTVLLLALVFSPSAPSPSGDAASQVPTSLVSLKPISERVPVSDQADPEGADLMKWIVTADELPTLTHEEITAVDLFRHAAVEVVQAAPEQAPPQTEIKPAVQYTVGAVYGAYSGTDRKALIDGKIVRSGEQLENGVVVLEVSSEGVHVAP